MVQPPAIDGTMFPRSLRWRLQLGLLDLPVGDASLWEQNRNKLRLQRERFITLSERHERAFCASRRELESNSQSLDLSSSGDDPLTAAVKEQELHDQRFRRKSVTAERRRSMQRRRVSNQTIHDEIPYSCTERLELIQKDIKRLDPEHAEPYHSRISWHLHDKVLEPVEFNQSMKTRNDGLTCMLYIYSSEYGRYYQGMHEICSYVQLVVEQDLFRQETCFKDDMKHFLDGKYLIQDTYTLFECIMDSLARCYEESEDTSNSVVSNIPYVACDKELYTHIQAVPTAHEVYIARWVRLMFTREIQDFRLALELWDLFMDLISKEPSITSMDKSRYKGTGMEVPFEVGNRELYQVLEMTAASLIWMRRKELLAKGTEGALQILVNSRPLESVAELKATLLSSLHRLDSSGHMAPLRPPSKEVVIPFRRLSLSMKALPSLIHRRQSGNHCDGDLASSLNLCREPALQRLMDLGTCVSKLLNEDEEDDDDQMGVSYYHGTVGRELVFCSEFYETSDEDSLSIGDMETDHQIELHEESYSSKGSLQMLVERVKRRCSYDSTHTDPELRSKGDALQNFVGRAKRRGSNDSSLVGSEDRPTTGNSLQYLVGRVRHGNRDGVTIEHELRPIRKAATGDSASTIDSILSASPTDTKEMETFRV